MAARSQSEIFHRSLGELSALGALPNELALLAGDDPRRLLEIAAFLLGAGQPDQADSIVTAASQVGASPLEVAILHARITLTGTNLTATQQAVVHAKQLSPTDPRVALLEAEQMSRQASADGGAEALGVVEHALDRDPNNLDLQRKRIDIVVRFERWSAADRAIVGFKQALQESVGSTVEANLAAAGIYARLGRTSDALTEFRIATTADPSNPGIWRQFATFAETARYYVVAREAYAELLRLAPDQAAREAIRRLDELQAAERVGTATPSGLPAHAR
jgi:predicted Zn-dependent protease